MIQWTISLSMPLVGTHMEPYGTHLLQYMSSVFCPTSEAPTAGILYSNSTLTKVVPGALTWICVNTGGHDLRRPPATKSRTVSPSWKNEIRATPSERLFWHGTSI